MYARNERFLAPTIILMLVVVNVSCGQNTTPVTAQITTQYGTCTYAGNGPQTSLITYGCLPPGTPNAGCSVASNAGASQVTCPSAAPVPALPPGTNTAGSSTATTATG